MRLDGGWDAWREECQCRWWHGGGLWEVVVGASDCGVNLEVGVCTCGAVVGCDVRWCNVCVLDAGSGHGGTC